MLCSDFRQDLRISNAEDIEQLATIEPVQAVPTMAKSESHSGGNAFRVCQDTEGCHR